MKKEIIVAMSLALLSPAAQVYAEDMMHAHSSAEYCTKHCRTTDLRKEVTALEEAIRKTKAENPMGGGGKLMEMQVRAKATREHLSKHEKELADVQAELDKTEAELKQLEGK